MAITNFTVEYKLFSNQADGSDAGLDVDIIALVGTVTFTPVAIDARPIQAPGYSPDPAGFRIRPITGYIDSDGVLYAERGGAEGVRLWANDPVFQLPKLVYQVDFNVTTPLGEQVRVDRGYLTAPATDTTVNLADVMESSAPAAFGAPAIASGTFTEDSVAFVNADGSAVAAIEIPEGVLVFTDNGDSTWSVGI